MPWLLKLACLVLACNLTVHSSVTGGGGGGGGDAIARLPPLAAVRLPAGGWLPEIRRTAPAAALTMPASAAQAAAPAALSPLRLVFAHMMLCFAAFSAPGNSSAAIAGYVREIGVARAAGLDGLAVEYLGRDAYYAPAAQGMFAACAAANAAAPAGSPPFRLFLIINFCCGLNLTDAVNLYAAYHNHSCALRIDGRPVFSSWSAVDWRAGGPAEQARWQRDFFAPIAALGLPRPFFFPFIYAYDEATGTYEETATLAEQAATLSAFSEILDGLWYWGCAPPGDAVAASSLATAQACAAAGKRSAVPVSAPYSPHIGDRAAAGNNRYTQGNGGRAIQQAWRAHIGSTADLVIATTWNDLGEHHYIGPYNKTLWGHDTVSGWDAGSGPNLFPHQAYLDLSAYYIRWFKLPAGSPAPPVPPDDERLVYFYNLQPVNNSCPGDPVGPLSKIAGDAQYPLEDAVYVTALLAAPANISIFSGDNPPRTFAVGAGLADVQAPAAPGVQRFVLTRDGAELVNVTGSEAVNSTAQAAGICNSQTFSGTVRVQAQR